MNDTRSTTAVVSDDRQPSLAVLDLVARVEGVDPVDLDPLYDAIDPEALDTLCDPDSGFSRLEFTYHGHAVVVKAADGDLSISLADASAPAEEPTGELVDGEL